MTPGDRLFFDSLGVGCDQLALVWELLLHEATREFASKRNFDLAHFPNATIRRVDGLRKVLLALLSPVFVGSLRLGLARDLHTRCFVMLARV